MYLGVILSMLFLGSLQGIVMEYLVWCRTSFEIERAKNEDYKAVGARC